MMRFLSRRPSAALVVSIVALMVALGGTSYAAFNLPKNSVGTKQLKNNAVTNTKIANGAVTGSKVNLSTLGTVPNAGHAASADTANTANTANSASNAMSANHAKNSDQLGGLPVSSFVQGPAEAWHELGPADFITCSFVPPATWNNFSASDSTAAFFRDQAGMVHLKGVVSCPHAVTNPNILQLPAGYQPQLSSFFPVDVNGTANSELSIAPDGEVVVSPNPGANAYVSLDGISFRCGPPGSNGCP
jgi:hypothetical protein